MNQINSLVHKNNKVQISCERNTYKLLFLPNRTVFPNGDISLNSDQLLECLEKMEDNIDIESGEGFNLKLFKKNNIKTNENSDCDA